VYIIAANTPEVWVSILSTGPDSMPRRPLSASILDPITKAYHVGGLALSMLVLGALLMLTATVVQLQWLTIALVTTGFLLVGVVCCLFFVKELRPLARAQRVTRQNKELIDGIQAASVELTDLALEFQALAFKNSQQINAALTAIIPVVRKIPQIGPKVADSQVVQDSNSLSRQIVDLTQGWGEVVSDLRDALIMPDPAKLRKYIKELTRVRVAVGGFNRSWRHNASR
jgi:hypothetical protein